MLARSFPAVCLVAALLFTGTAAAQSPRERQAILVAVRDFADAVEAGDAERLTRSIWVHDGAVMDRLGRDLFVQLVLAQKQLERTAVARFGAAGGRFRCHFSAVFSASDRADLADAGVYFDVDSLGGARVQQPGETYSIRLRRAPDGGGRWQVVLEILLEQYVNDANGARPKEVSQLLLGRYEAQVAGVQEVAVRVEKGEYESAAAAEADLMARYERADEEFREKWNALPGSRRGRIPWRYYR